MNGHQVSLNEQQRDARTALALEKALNRRAMAQLTSDAVWATRRKKIHGSQQKKMPRDRLRGRLMRAVTRALRNVASQAMRPVTNKAGGGTHIQESIHSLERRHFEHEITTTILNKS